MSVTIAAQLVTFELRTHCITFSAEKTKQNKAVLTRNDGVVASVPLGAMFARLARHASLAPAALDPLRSVQYPRVGRP